MYNPLETSNLKRTHEQIPPGPWKENRQGAVSLCYLGLEPNALEMVLAHHAAVGIRASLVCGAVEPLLSVPAESNWDLLADREDTDLLTALERLDDHHARIWCAPIRDIALFRHTCTSAISKPISGYAHAVDSGPTRLTWDDPKTLAWTREWIDRIRQDYSDMPLTFSTQMQGDGCQSTF